MAETAITAVLSKFGELASREAAVLLQVGNDMMLLRDRLEWLQAFIRDADRKRRLGADDLTCVWVRQTRDVAFEAEDALDDFFHKVDLESQGYRGWKIWLGFISGFFTQITIRHGLSSQIQRIKDRLDQISVNQKEYNIEHTPSGTWTSSFTEVALWDKLGNHMVGFDIYFSSLMRLLGNEKDQDHLAFFSVLGESGIGKNTLMRHVYGQVLYGQEHPAFAVVVWYNMPPNSSTEDLLKEVYKRVLRNNHMKTEQDNIDCHQAEDTDISEKLRRKLKGKRYLLILGGISSKSILNCVGASVPDDKNGSRVVLILEPESEEVARHADTLDSRHRNETRDATSRSSTFRMSRLDKAKSGELFRLTVFGGKPAEVSMGTTHRSNNRNSKGEYYMGKRTEDIKNDVKIYDQDIYDITGGHPLAIVVLAGLLRAKEKPLEWEAVLAQFKPGTEAEGCHVNQIKGVFLSTERPVDLNMVMQQITPAREAKLSNRMSIERIFSTSFDDLPHDLKSCFLYFAAYPKNLIHQADLILRMWTAEGFIKPQKGKAMEELGQDYLKELVSRCLVELVEKTKHGEIRLVRVHNRLLCFLQSEAREASFIEVHDKNDVLAPAAVRRLSIQDDSGSYTTFRYNFPKLRSFICRVDVEDHIEDNAGPKKKTTSSGHLCMRPCCLGDGRGSSSSAVKYNIKPNHDIKFLGGSKFLRVMSVHGLRIEELPEEIGSMIHLRYLCVSCKNLKKLPSSIRRLLNLQTLDIRNTKVEQIDKKFWKITTLRHVLAEELVLPVSVIKGPDELQTLHGVRPGSEIWDQEKCPLDSLAKLRSLELHGFSAAKHGGALTSALEKMDRLGHLKLKGDQIPSCVFMTPSLRYLHTLVLEGNVKWHEVTPDVCKLRPNLVYLEPEVPQDFKPKLPGFMAEQRD